MVPKIFTDALNIFQSTIVLNCFYIHIWSIFKFPACNSDPVLQVSASGDCEIGSLSVQTNSSVGGKVLCFTSDLKSDHNQPPCVLKPFFKDKLNDALQCLSFQQQVNITLNLIRCQVSATELAEAIVVFDLPLPLPSKSVVRVIMLMPHISSCSGMDSEEDGGVLI